MGAGGPANYLLTESGFSGEPVISSEQRKEGFKVHFPCPTVRFTFRPVSLKTAEQRASFWSCLWLRKSLSQMLPRQEIKAHRDSPVGQLRFLCTWSGAVQQTASAKKYWLASVAWGLRSQFQCRHWEGTRCNEFLSQYKMFTTIISAGSVFMGP